MERFILRISLRQQSNICTESKIPVFLQQTVLQEAIPEVNWLHGHSGEILSIESTEKLGLFLVDELRKTEENKDMFFDNYNQKKYVLGDILTFMCPELKKRLKAAGKIDNKRLQNIKNLMVNIEDEDYINWNNLEEHLSLERLNGILM